MQQALNSFSQFFTFQLAQLSRDLSIVNLSLMYVYARCRLQSVEFQRYRSSCEQIGLESIILLHLILINRAQFLRRRVKIQRRRDINPLRLLNQPRIFQINAFGLLIQSHAFQRQMFILPLEAMIILPQSTHQSSCYLLNFKLIEPVPEQPSLA